MTAQEVADALSLLRYSCRLKLSRHEISAYHREEFLPRRASVDVESFLQQQKSNKNSSNTLLV